MSDEYRVFVGRSCVLKTNDFDKANRFSENTMNTHGQSSSVITVTDESEFNRQHTENAYSADLKGSCLFDRIRLA